MKRSSSLRRLALIFLSVLLLPLLNSCWAKHASPEPSGYAVLDRYRSESEEVASLFRGDSDVLSDSDISRILDFRLRLGDRNRLAVLKLGTTRYWSEAHARIDQDNQDSFLERLRSAAPVVHVAPLPKLLVPEKVTVPYLREAAARYQADLLLVYSASVRTFTKYRTLGKDEVRALCVVEAVLLDVRTGIVPFTSRTTEEVIVTRDDTDLNFSETTAKAIAEAEGQALAGIARETISFLNAIDDT